MYIHFGFWPDKESGNEILSQVQAATILLAKYQGTLFSTNFEFF